MVTRGGSRPATAEQRLEELGVQIPTPPEPFGIYAGAVQTGHLLFLTDAKAVAFLASDESSYLTGIELFVDGGVAQV